MNEYGKRINRVMDYIEKNLDKELTLNELAASLLCFEKNRTLMEIALDCGYSNAASFSKSFKAYHGVSPSLWNRKSNIGQVDSNNGKEFIRHLVDTDLSNNWRYSMDKKSVSAEVKEIQQETVAYVRHIGPYAGNEALFGKLYGQLCQWAGPRDLISDDAKFISIYNDNPEITDEEKLRISICLVVPEGTAGDGDINIMTISSGYEPDERPKKPPCLETYCRYLRAGQTNVTKLLETPSCGCSGLVHDV
jgi:AraC family transcriptional regulator